MQRTHSLPDAEHTLDNHPAGLNEERAVAGMHGTAPFRAQARIIRLLGEELISDEVMAVLELVKNAYDADARNVTIEVHPQDNSETNEIVVRDDGDGMELDTILRSWLEPATRRKRGGRWKRRTALGRFPLGEKGVGRFAADKLGAEMDLITRARGSGTEVVLSINWNMFETDAHLENVQSHWEVRTPRTFIASPYGTEIRIRDLRAKWDSALVEKVSNGLSRLISPARQEHDFTILLDCPHLPEFCGPVQNQLLGQAPYSLRATVDGSGVLRIHDAAGSRAPIDLLLKASEHFMDEDGIPRNPSCGPFTITLYAWDLDNAGLRKAGMDRKKRQVLKQWCGISIYRDSFRVLPYGEQDDDWLELNQRRVNNPTLRLSNNQVIGIVEITQRDNPELRDRTSREGMVDTPALADFKQLVLGTLAHLEERRFSDRRLGQEVSGSTVGDAEPDAVLRLMLALKGESKPSSLTELERAYRTKLSEVKRREDSLLLLAGLGVAAERLTDEIAGVLATALAMAEITRKQLAKPSEGASGEADTRLRQLEALLSYAEDQLDILSPLRMSKPGGREHVDLRSAIQDALAVFSRQFRRAGIEIVVTANGSPTLFAQYGHLVQIVLALFDNSLYWVTHAPQTLTPKIHVHVWRDRKWGGLVVADNGPGIMLEQAKLIFEPSYSTRREGLGLGLFIVRSLLERYAGTIELSRENRLLPGANIEVRFRLP